MIARITPYQLKSASAEITGKMMEQMKDDILALPGLLQVINVQNENGAGYVISIVESEEFMDRNVGRVNAIWSRFDEHFEDLPSPEFYAVCNNWVNRSPDPLAAIPA